MSVTSSEIGTPPPPLPQASVYPLPEPKEGGAHSPAGEGVGGSRLGRLEKKPSTLSTLWVGPRIEQNQNIHLELVLLAAEVGALLLPEVVRLDDEGGVDAAPKLVLQHLHTKQHVLKGHSVEMRRQKI